MMDIDQQAAVLQKKLEKLNWQLDNNPDLSKTKRKKIEDKVADIRKQLLVFERQLTPLAMTKLVHTTHKWGGYDGGP